ncbi:MAG: GIY-YIG nuclease family protein [Dehalococcoidales bacterium]|nr:GIY-YIG nuclease family protein [Dehalococcoidales bacterium]
MDSYYVYILASKRNGTLYTGMTSDLIQRVYTHKNDFADGFTKRYGVHMLVYFEQWEDREGALKREKQIKEWKRKWKLELIEKNNPEWNDLYDQIISS